MMKSAVKKVLSSTDKNEVETLYRKAISIIDSLASKKILHKKTAARRKSALTKYVNSLS
jgi:small subunit ribosomal protein S20